jgi:TPR repeat protein
VASLRTCLLLACLLLSVAVPVIARGQADEVATPSLEDVQAVFEQLLAASDAGDRGAFMRFTRLYASLYEQAYFEVSANVPKTAMEMIPELDQWFLHQAEGGSATAQYWIAERTKLLQRYGAKPPEIAAITPWYRASAEQGFAPAQDALGQILGFFPELAQAPFEAEKWLFLAALQDHPLAAERLLQAIDIDNQRAGYRPGPDIMAWLQQKAAAGDTRAQALLDRLAAPE